MKKYYANMGNEFYSFNTSEKAKTYASENGLEYIERREWRYYVPQKGYTSFEGEDLISAVEGNMPKFLELMGLVGASGRILKSATLTRDKDNKIMLSVTGYPFSTGLVGFSEDMLNEANLKHGEMEIMDVTDDELEGDKYVFELK